MKNFLYKIIEFLKDLLQKISDFLKRRISEGEEKPLEEEKPIEEEKPEL